MTEQDVKAIFTDKIVGEEIVLSQNLTVPVPIFTMLFANAQGTYASLIENDLGKGYIPFFDQCKAEGILN